MTNEANVPLDDKRRDEIQARCDQASMGYGKITYVEYVRDVRLLLREIERLNEVKPIKKK